MRNNPTKKTHWLAHVSLPFSIFGLLISPLTFLFWVCIEEKLAGSLL